MDEEKCEGIVLRSLDYKERERIITLFTPEAGVVSLIVKGISKKNYSLLALTTLFCRAEFLYRRGKSDLFRFVDGTILNEHPSLRSRLSSLQAAAELSRAILHSQFPGKASPALYALFSLYLAQIPEFETPGALIASFMLKLLRHEGVLSLSAECTLPALQRFSPSEWKVLEILAHSRQFAALKTLCVDLDLLEKVRVLFSEALHH